jgi:hypothetical protein
VSARGRVADAAAVGGLVAVIAALLAFGLLFGGDSLLTSLQGPAPCGVKGSLPNPQPDPACLSAHADYYQYDPANYSWTTPESRLAQTVEPIAWPAAIYLALGGGLTGGIALALSTRRRRTALTALTLSSVIVVGIVVFFIGLIAGGGD